MLIILAVVVAQKGTFLHQSHRLKGTEEIAYIFFFCCVCMQVDVRVFACVYQNMWRLEAKSVSPSGELHFIGFERPGICKLLLRDLQGSDRVCVPSTLCARVTGSSCRTRMSCGCWSSLWHSKHSPHWATSSLRKQCHSHSSGHFIQSGDQQAWAPTRRGPLQEIPAALPPVLRARDDESWLNAEDKKSWVDFFSHFTWDSLDLNSSEGV